MIVSYDTQNEQHGLLQQAYRYFNESLFDEQLPVCVITMQRKKNTHGYFAAERFTSRTSSATKTDEIAMNPETMDRDDLTILSTLVHEMCHLWQQHHGKPSRAGYHNREWAGKMRDVGLEPVSLDKPGKDTGQKVTHAIIEAGRFAAAAAALLETGYTLQWCATPEGEKTRTRAKNKIVYLCEMCDTKVWGKPGIRLICGDCGEPMLQEGLLDD
jgi:predicted SprT family Zn-dependent metalloprotease